MTGQFLEPLHEGDALKCWQNFPFKDDVLAFSSCILFPLARRLTMLSVSLASLARRVPAVRRINVPPPFDGEHVPLALKQLESCPGNQPRGLLKRIPIEELVVGTPNDQRLGAVPVEVGREEDPVGPNDRGRVLELRGESPLVPPGPEPFKPVVSRPTEQDRVVPHQTVEVAGLQRGDLGFDPPPSIGGKPMGADQQD